MKDTFTSINDPEPSAMLEPVRRHSIFAIQCELTTALMRNRVEMLEKVCKLIATQAQAMLRNRP
jgi:hypothetical protein